jgi:hypothetical protein
VGIVDVIFFTEATFGTLTGSFKLKTAQFEIKKKNLRPTSFWQLI